VIEPPAAAEHALLERRRGFLANIVRAGLPDAVVRVRPRSGVAAPTLSRVDPKVMIGPRVRRAACASFICGVGLRDDEGESPAAIQHALLDFGRFVIRSSRGVALSRIRVQSSVTALSLGCAPHVVEGGAVDIGGVRRDVIERPAVRAHAFFESGNVSERIVRRRPARATVGEFLGLATLNAVGTKDIPIDLRLGTGGLHAEDDGSALKTAVATATRRSDLRIDTPPTGAAAKSDSCVRIGRFIVFSSACLSLFQSSCGRMFQIVMGWRQMMCGHARSGSSLSQKDLRVRALCKIFSELRGHPPHRSGPDSGIRLLPRVFDGEALFGSGRKDARRGKPAVGQFRHPIPREAVLLAAPPKRSTPEVDQVMPKR
jgi:hypothetical protein